MKSKLRFRNFAVVSILLISLLAALGSHETTKADSDQLSAVEAAFIFQFTNYIEWPSRKPGQAVDTEKFVITVVGESALSKKLKAIASSKEAKGRPVEILTAAEPSQLKPSHIVYISSSDEKVLKAVLSKTENTGALVVAHADGFAKLGAMINFFVEAGRVRFEINRSAASQRELQLSSQLLKLAKLVD